MKKAFVIRTGAYGDMVIISPLFRALKEAGYHVTLNTGDRGVEVLKNNPYIDKYIVYKKEGVNDPEIERYWKDLEKKENADWFRNFAESIEVNVALHPRSPVYIYPKNERRERGEKNYYEATEEVSGLKFNKIIPDLFIDKNEEKDCQKYINKDKINILWCLSGSGSNKAYPWADYIMGEMLKNNQDMHIITVGNEKCQILESLIDDENITNLSGKVPFRTSMVLTKMCDLVISPDTGVLHASGAFDTPKVGILGHTTINNITKHFVNDFSIEPDVELCECSPCYRLIYNHKIQCPVDKLSGAAWCMAHGHPPQRLYNRIMEAVINVRDRKQSKSIS